MTAIQFYQLTSTPLERALPKLLEKALAGGFKVLVSAASETQAERIDQMLWTYHPGSFLPHGRAQDGNPEMQPVFISTEQDAPNGANVLVITGGRSARSPDRFERVLDIFDGNDPDAVAQARNRWTGYKSGGHAVTYLCQNESGGWEQKAVA